MEHEQLTRPIALVQKGELRVQPEEAVERPRRRIAPTGRGERERPAQARVIGITVRRHGREPVERATQQHEHQPRPPGRGREADTHERGRGPARKQGQEPRRSRSACRHS